MFLNKRLILSLCYPLSFTVPVPPPPPISYPELSTELSTWCGNRLAVCVLHIACSQRLRRSVQNNNHKSGLSAGCQDRLVVGSLQHTRAARLSFPRKKKTLEIPKFRRQGTWNEEGKSLPRFACVMSGSDGDGPQVLLLHGWNLWIYLGGVSGRAG